MLSIYVHIYLLIKVFFSNMHKSTLHVDLLKKTVGFEIKKTYHGGGQKPPSGGPSLARWDESRPPKNSSAASRQHLRWPMFFLGHSSKIGPVISYIYRVKLVISVLITPISRVITPVTYLCSAIYRSYNSTYSW